LLTDKHLDVPLDFESISAPVTPDNPDAPASMLGTRALQIFDETTCVVRATYRWTDFYAHESCGKCTPCREGTYWLKQILHRIEHGQGTDEDIDKLLDIGDNILGRSFCALGDGAVSPIASSVRFFRDEYVRHQTERGCPFDPAASTLFAQTATVSAS
jgi:NADH-quinone oxidoreductase subunit F